MAEMSDAECELALKSFAELTGTDEACAHFFLQDVNWELQAALNNFFECGSHEDGSRRTEAASKGEKERSAEVTSPPQPSLDSFTVLSWNVDGLDKANLKTRFTAVCYIISKISAEAVFLQELAPELVPELRKNLSGEYSILLSTPSQLYFTGILLKPNVEYISHKCIPYANSGMGRAMELVEAKIGDMNVRLLNTHLESMQEHSEIRKAQLQQCFEQLKEWNDGHTLIIFGGDLNIRDHEVGDLPAGFRDAWVAAGSKSKWRFTWDTRLNDNKSAGGARCRFDRLYFNGSLHEHELLCGTKDVYLFLTNLTLLLPQFTAICVFAFCCFLGGGL
ncbi:5'-tyrosyl-DNA phosphodiesterase [Toxocara canis]|uniref:5'-tyrosyl-DNA phosphodiesterase n=1 Tax=Toxocara canis TaxID=6265 RepID=A0A0B2VQV0_TOXCA|nr:5'-tyrosyl-DNA phosphodiesterase [Toxocara canis]